MHARTALPCDPQSVRSARGFVMSKLASWGVSDDVVETVRLLVSEVVSNAVLHARTPFAVDIERDDVAIRVAVVDRDSRTVVRRNRRVDAATGRGLVLLDELSTAWGVEPSSDGKRVWFEVRMDRQRPGREPDLDSYLALDGGTA